MSIKPIEHDTKWRIVASSFIYDPTSAVKELIDNSIDANANTIHIDIDSKTGGCEYIHVRDSGSGVPVMDRDKMCLNYTTSKIDSLANLDNLQSLGFRGEALFHLSHLANQKGSLQIITRTKDDSCGEKWFVDKDGRIDLQTRGKISSPIGTSVTIRNLMGGLRARKIDLTNRFRQTIDKLRQLINHYSLIFTDIRFIFSSVSLNKNGSISNKQLQSSSNTKLNRIRALANLIQLRKQNKVTDNFIDKEHYVINSWINLDLILPIPLPSNDIIDIKKKYKFLSINSRPMSIHLQLGQSINKILNKIYKDNNILEPNVWFININCQSNVIDFNIEPEKNDALIKNIDEILNDLELRLNELITEEFGTFSISPSQQINNDTMGEANSQELINLVDDEPEDRAVPAVEYLNLSAERYKPRKQLFVDDYDSLLVDDNTTLMNADTTKISASPQKEEYKLTNNGQDETKKTKNNKVASLENGKDSSDAHIWERDYMTEMLQTSSSQNGTTLRTSPSIGNSRSDFDHNQFDFTNDDIELAKHKSLSNPFTIVKLKNSTKNKASDNNIPIDNKGVNTFKQVRITDMQKDRKRNFDQLNAPLNFNNPIENIMIKEKVNTITKKPQTKLNAFSFVNKGSSNVGTKKKKLKMFAEYTTIYETTLKVPPPSNITDAEDAWLQKTHPNYIWDSIVRILIRKNLDPNDYLLTESQTGPWSILTEK